MIKRNAFMEQIRTKIGSGIVSGALIFGSIFAIATFSSESAYAATDYKAKAISEAQKIVNNTNYSAVKSGVNSYALKNGTYGLAAYMKSNSAYTKFIKSQTQKNGEYRKNIGGGYYLRLSYHHDGPMNVRWKVADGAWTVGSLDYNKTVKMTKGQKFKFQGRIHVDVCNSQNKVVKTVWGKWGSTSSWTVPSTGKYSVTVGYSTAD
jgi:hypothetical protein